MERINKERNKYREQKKTLLSMGDRKIQHRKRDSPINKTEHTQQKGDSAINKTEHAKKKRERRGEKKDSAINTTVDHNTKKNEAALCYQWEIERFIVEYETLLSIERNSKHETLLSI